MLLAYLSDLHLSAQKLAYGIVDTHKALDNAIDLLNYLDPTPDLCLVTGDIAADGSEIVYAKAQKSFSKTGIPFRMLTGNHDYKKPWNGR